MPAKKKQQQATLSQQRALLKKLTERLAELAHAAGDQSDDENWSEEGEDILLQLVPPSAVAVKDSQPSQTPPSPASVSSPTSNEATQTSPSAPTQSAGTSIPSPSSTLRSRNQREALLGTSATTTSSDVQASFKPSPDAPSKDGVSKETADVLASADSEQTQLTTAMLSLAAALKQSAQTFASDLDADKGAVRNTELALDKNKEGMERTSGGMARLRKMSEGKWWVTRVGMMVLIPVLWVVLLLEVFVMPKLRLS